jgi:hypothetical protein
MIDLETLVDYFEEAEDASTTARYESERCRDYYDGNQLTSEELSTLKKRNQPKVVVNMIQPKVDMLLGVERTTRTSPKAFPRTPAHDDGADAVTDAIRYVLDNNDFDVIASDVFENMLIEGTGGCSVEVDENLNIRLKQFRWDRFFADPHSMSRDFSDARYMGVVVWMDLPEAEARWGERAEELEAQMRQSATQGETFDDKPQHWYDSKRNRVMVVDMYFRHQGVWHKAIFARGVWLEDPAPSPYVDELGRPAKCLIPHSAKVSRDGHRYGWVSNYLDTQDEINKRRSKSLHMLNSRQTFAKEGRITDINKFKREANKSDGHMEFPNDGTFGNDFGFIPNEGLVGPQFQMYQESIARMDTISASGVILGKSQGDLSGRAVQSLQQRDMAELGMLFDAHSQWKKQVYRAIWDRIKQFWQQEKWIRVTDDENTLRFVGLNEPITIAEANIAQELGIHPHEVKQQFQQELQLMYRDNPILAQQAQTLNDVVEMDVDIIIEEVPDVVNLQAEQFQLLAQMYMSAPDKIPFEAVIEMSTLRNKDKLLKKQPTPEEQQMMQQQQQEREIMLQAELGDKMADIRKKNADALGKEEKALQTAVETELLQTNPPPEKVSMI